MRSLWKKWVMQMKIRKEDFRGTGKVFRFTLEQMLKGKAYIIFAVLLLLLAIASVPVMALLMGEEDTGAETSLITAVYVQNETGYDLDLTKISQQNEMFAQTHFLDTDWTEETFGENLQPSEVYVHMSRDMEGIQIAAFTLDTAEFSEMETNQCTDALSALLDEARLQALHATPDQIGMLMTGYEAEVKSVDEFLQKNADNRQELSEEEVEARLSAQLTYCVVVLMLCLFVIVFIIQKVIEEKASKLAEFLLVSVQPLALLLGKILAVMTYVFGLAVLVVVSFAASYGITSMFADTSAVAQSMASMGITSDLLRLSPAAAAVIFLALLLAYFTISLFCGLVGACCSTMEDVEPANLIVVLFLMAGYILSVSLSGTDNPVISAIAVLVPFVSMFAAPVRYLLGDIGAGMLVLSFAIQVLVILLFAYLCARTYRDLLMYQGERLKIGRLLSMAAGRSKEVQK